MTYICPQCGKEHEEWPAIAFKSPQPYHGLSEYDKNNIAELTDDFCIIRHPEQTDRFIRAVLQMEVKNNCKLLNYGIWVALSEKSYNDYIERLLKHENREATYFGFICNTPPEYEYFSGIKANVVVGNDNNRPLIYPHTDQMDIPYVRDVYEGITTEEALRRIATIL